MTDVVVVLKLLIIVEWQLEVSRIFKLPVMALRLRDRRRQLGSGKQCAKSLYHVIRLRG